MSLEDKAFKIISGPIPNSSPTVRTNFILLLKTFLLKFIKIVLLGLNILIHKVPVGLDSENLNVITLKF